MYTHFFHLNHAPFSIAPDPRYLFMTHGHREALAHLLYGVNSGGGLVLLTGEIGAGKTTVCRYFLEQVPPNSNLAYIFNPKLTVIELLQSICDEFRVDIGGREANAPASVKDYVDALTRYLLATHAHGQNNVLIIDEAQNLSAEVLEQLRLLTNLETSERKLLQIVLIGQPELRAMLDRPDLRQLAQRVIARYHLEALSEQETASYIQHRLSIAGLATTTPFQQPLMKQIHSLAQGIPRRINLLCDRALLGAYAEGKHEVDRAIVNRAAAEVFGIDPAAASAGSKSRRRAMLGATGLAAGGAIVWAAASMNSGLTMKRVLPGKPVTPAVAAKAEPTKAAARAAGHDSPPPATLVPSELDVISGIGLESKADAYRQLAQMWGTALPDGAEPCPAARAYHLRCYAGSGGLAELRQLDRPALLTLRDRAKRTYQVLLTGLSDTDATLRVDGASQTISMMALMRYFQGDFVTLWRAPQLYRNRVEYGDQGPEVDWIAVQLAKINGDKTSGKNRPFDEKMLQRVREFQLAQGLKVDGLVGPVTFMHLNRVAGLEEPRLKTGRAAIQAQAME
jgi:general secretion pathway protein A